jgi:hypothetical protein
MLSSQISRRKICSRKVVLGKSGTIWKIGSYSENRELFGKSGTFQKTGNIFFSSLCFLTLLSPYPLFLFLSLTLILSYFDSLVSMLLYRLYTLYPISFFSYLPYLLCLFLQSYISFFVSLIWHFMIILVSLSLSFSLSLSLSLSHTLSLTHSLSLSVSLCIR